MSGVPPLEDLYRIMARARAFELLLADLWQRGLISGEMHLGTGEEAVAAGVCVHLREGDAVALDHRATPVLIARGLDPAPLLREMLGRDDGLCRGRGGHMHLLSPADLAASSGIVGSSAPLGAGFALAASMLRPGAMAVSFFGEGAANQGMLLETLNLAVAWSLPLLFVCKDNEWAITTRSARVTSGNLVERARAFGMAAVAVDGGEVTAVAEAAGEAVERVRRDAAPMFILARCPRPDGHMMGDPLRRIAANPLREGARTFAEVSAAVVSRRGGGLGARASSVASILDRVRRAGADGRERNDDPLRRARARLPTAAAAQVDAEVGAEMQALLEYVDVEVPG